MPGPFDDIFPIGHFSNQEHSVKTGRNRIYGAQNRRRDINQCRAEDNDGRKKIIQHVLFWRNANTISRADCV